MVISILEDKDNKEIVPLKVKNVLEEYDEIMHESLRNNLLHVRDFIMRLILGTSHSTKYTNT